MTRILVYSHDTFGLGNIRRMLRISEALVEHDPDCFGADRHRIADAARLPPAKPHRLCEAALPRAGHARDLRGQAPRHGLCRCAADARRADPFGGERFCPRHCAGGQEAAGRGRRACADAGTAGAAVAPTGDASAAARYPRYPGRHAPCMGRERLSRRDCPVLRQRAGGGRSAGVRPCDGLCFPAADPRQAAILRLHRSRPPTGGSIGLSPAR